MTDVEVATRNLEVLLRTGDMDVDAKTRDRLMAIKGFNKNANRKYNKGLDGLDGIQIFATADDLKYANDMTTRRIRMASKLRNKLKTKQ